MAGYHLATGGKRLRALLPPWIAAALGGDPEAALGLGVGLELLHNATLVHDDLQDGDVVRRGQPTVWRRYGVAQAINAGDALYFLGMEQLLGSATGVRTASFAARALTRVIEGQVLEFQLQDPAGGLPVTLASWERMARCKTGALFGACFHAGGCAAGVDDERLAELAAHGEQLGLLFQVQDDLLDLVGDKGRDRRGSDLAEGKRSYPVVWVLTHAPPADRAALAAVVQAPREATTDDMIADALRVLDRTGALASTAGWVRRCASELEAGPVRLPGLIQRILAPVAHALPPAEGP